MTREDNDPIPTERLFREHAGFVARFLYRLGVASASVEDLVQEVFLVVHRQGGYRPGLASPTTYLAGVAAGLHANHRRKERTRTLTLRRLWGERTPDVQTITPAHLVEADETQRALARALEVLSGDERTVLVMADLEQLPCPEIASVLSLPLGTVYFRLHVARERWVREFERVQRPLVSTRPPLPERVR